MSSPLGRLGYRIVDPHVHVWVNVADDPSVKLNAKG